MVDVDLLIAIILCIFIAPLGYWWKFREFDMWFVIILICSLCSFGVLGAILAILKVIGVF